MRVVVQHRSRCHYPRPGLPGPQLIRLRPAGHTRARIESYQLLVEPEHRLHWLRDPHGNRVARVTFKALTFVCEEADRLSGVAMASMAGEVLVLYLDSVDVGRGLGRRLLDKLTSRSRLRPILKRRVPPMAQHGRSRIAATDRNGRSRSFVPRTTLHDVDRAADTAKRPNGDRIPTTSNRP